MELFLTTFTSTLTPQIIFAMLGGLLGAMISSDTKRYGWQLSLMFTVSSVAMSAAMGEYLQGERGLSSIWLLFVLNIPLGMVVGSTLDVIRISSPTLIERLIVNIGDSGVSIVVESVVAKLTRFLGVKEPYILEGEPKLIQKTNEDKKETDTKAEEDS